MTKYLFYFCTRNIDPKDTQACRSLSKIKNIDIAYDSDNKTGLSTNYNNILQKHSDTYDYITFIHDDVYVDDLNVCEKLHTAHKEYDIVGLAGGVNPKITEPALWHIMCGGFNSTNLRGAVAHPLQEKTILMTSFGPTPSRVALLDGLFISVNTKKIKEVSWKFNENYTFHHYDIASSIDANKKKLKLGVTPIWVIHKSPGLLDPNSSVFLSSQEKFIQEYS